LAVAPDVAAAMATWGAGRPRWPTDERQGKPMSDLQASSLALRAAGSYGNRPEPMPFLHILAVDDREDVRGEHGPLT